MVCMVETNVLRVLCELGFPGLKLTAHFWQGKILQMHLALARVLMMMMKMVLGGQQLACLQLVWNLSIAWGVKKTSHRMQSMV